MDKTQLIAFITKNFSNVNREGGQSIHETQVIDDYGTEYERDVARKKDIDVHWSQIPDEYIKKIYCALSYANAISFRYHLPAFMIYALKKYNVSDDFSIDSTIYSLTTDHNQKLKKYKKAQISLFNKEQSSAVAYFLEFMVENGEGYVDTEIAKQALETYWKKYL